MALTLVSGKALAAGISWGNIDSVPPVASAIPLKDPGRWPGLSSHTPSVLKQFSQLLLAGH
jgi:hypothetical protein